MDLYLVILLFVLGTLLSAVFATLTYSLRDFSRARLDDALERRGLSKWLPTVTEHSGELAFLTASARLVCNLVVFVAILDFLRQQELRVWLEYLIGAGAAAVISIITAVTIPHALARYAGEPIIALFVRPLHGMRILCRPLSKLLHVTEHVVRKATTSPDVDVHDQAEEDLQSEILAVVEEGEKTGVVDETDREMIESVIEFRDTSVGQVMTARPEIIGLPRESTLADARALIEESGHSRIPVYEDSLDHIVGVLYARDLIKYVGESADQFRLTENLRPPFFVPESKLLRDLLQDFRLQKVHIAIVLDEYGGTAGLISIEDVLEELVGEISDEHEPLERPPFQRLDDQTAEVDAKFHIDELNRELGTDLDEDEGYDTLGGFVSTHLGRIPETGVSFEHNGVAFTVLEAEPQRVVRLRVRILPPTPANTPTDGAPARREE